MKDSNPYISTTKKDLSEMLLEIGVNRIDDLYRPIPEKLLLNRELLLPSPLKKIDLPLSEIELSGYMQEISAGNNSNCKYFLGAGCYNHYIPSIVDLALTVYK